MGAHNQGNISLAVRIKERHLEEMRGVPLLRNVTITPKVCPIHDLNFRKKAGGCQLARLEHGADNTKVAGSVPARGTVSYALLKKTKTKKTSNRKKAMNVSLPGSLENNKCYLCTPFFTLKS